MFDKAPYTPGMKDILKIAKAVATQYGHDYIGPEHYLLALLEKGEGFAIRTLENMGVDLKGLEAELRQMMKPGGESFSQQSPPNAEAKRVLEETKLIAQELRHNWIGTEHLLLGILKERDNLAARALERFDVVFERALPVVRNLVENSGLDSSPKGSKEHEKEKSKTPALDTFGRDLTQLAREGKLDPVIGRENEIERILQVLCRRSKNNPILLGEPGVGKTAIVEGLAQKIVNEDVPELLIGKRLISLDLAAVVAGTKYRGQFEERMKAIMQEIRRSQDVLVFIDELHTLIGAGAAEGAIDAANMLKPALSRGEMQCIGATTLSEYRKHIEKDGALERRFQPIIVNPPTPKQTIEILKGLRSRYEEHHGVVITDEAIEAAVYLSDRYITDRRLPDKAIDVIDEAGSRGRLQANTKPAEIKELEKKIAELDEELRVLSHRMEFEKCAEVKRQRDEAIERKNELFAAWRAKSADSKFVATISAEDVAQVVSKWTGVPLSRLEEEETQRLMKIEEALAKRVVSQEEAINAIARAIRRARAGLKDPNRPTASFIFLGPTGVGKTELAKALAEFLFGDEGALIRIDMSEYMEKFSISRLLGAPPGYVGYEEGGQLTEQVRRRPYSVVLFDEIEKAHPDVFHLLLQVFDDGRLTDSWGHVVDFRNTVIIMTSNVGTKNLRKSGTLGFTSADEIQDYKTLKDKLLGAMRQVFTPEFINRIDETIVFKSLTRDDIGRIVEIMVNRLNDRLQSKGIRVRLTEAAKSFLVDKGYDSEYGARPMRRAVQRYVEDPLAQLVVEGRVSKGEVVADLNSEKEE
ncbi:MAG: ATP-dependent Clp protease ATP-binding subunit, partial [Candidatus Sumerlaeaceae bacterium]|nr:ATP-dependent Clp protease ATP-binding subunit [Candidatus Sumerlaeaceae bacterium]